MKQNRLFTPLNLGEVIVFEKTKGVVVCVMSIVTGSIIEQQL